MQELGDSPRFLITRLSAIGDCIHTTPIAVALRRRYPNAFIGWITQRGPASLLEGLECIDELIPIERNWMKRLASVRQIRRILRDRHFDVVVDPQGLTKSSALGWLSGAKVRLGFSRGQARELSPWLNNQLITPESEHVVDRYLELLKPLGITSPSVEFQIPRRRAAIAMMDSFLVQARVSQFALINPGAGWDSKLWPHERYAELARRVLQEYGISSIVLWAGDRERQWAQSIASQAGAILAPSTTLPELAELCRRANLFVGSDTGPLHLAAAVGTRCVAMYGPTRPEVCGPYGPGHQTVQAYLQDGPGRHRRGEDNDAMCAISVDMTMQACQRALRSQAA